jgi:GNAT superfamily N-acetyltransferase
MGAAKATRMTYLTLPRSNLGSEHICCAFSDKKCADGYALKKRWLAEAFDHGYVFRRLDERAKVFIEYGPAESAWAPVSAPGRLMIGCFWVSGRYKGQGHGKALLQEAIADARRQGKAGLVTVVGTKKFHFMSDTRWLLGQGFTVVDSISSGFSLLAMDVADSGTPPSFSDSVRSGECQEKNGLVAYYSDRCPYGEFHVRESLAETAAKRDLPLTVVKLETMEQAQAAPTPATIFSLFRDGRFVTTDIGVCLDGRFDKIAG